MKFLLVCKMVFCNWYFVRDLINGWNVELFLSVEDNIKAKTKWFMTSTFIGTYPHQSPSINALSGKDS